MPTIRFRCIRCQHAVEAPESKIGRKMYCPVCFFQLTVPAEGTIKLVDDSDLYEADATPLDVRDMQARRDIASLRCDVCHTNIAVKREQIGEEIVCPECETKIVVPESIGEKFDAAKNLPKESKTSVSGLLDRITSNLASDDVYGVHRDPSGVVDADGKTRIPVHCKLCNTLMYATEDQIGRELTCPDCDTKTLVQAPVKKSGPAATGAAYEGGSTFGVENEIPVGSGPLVPVVCSLCETRMYALESEIGGMKICPDCGRENEIKAVPKKDLYIPDAPGDEYGMSSEPPPRPKIRTMTDYRFVEGALDKEHYDRQGITAEMLAGNSPALQIPKAVNFTQDISDQRERVDTHGAGAPLNPSLAGDSYGIQAPPPSPKRPTLPTDVPSLPTKPPPLAVLPDEAIDMETLRARNRARKEREGPKSSAPIRRPELPAHPFWTRLFVPLRNPWILLRSVAAIAAGTLGLYLGTALPGFYLFVGLPIGALFLFSAFGILADTSQSIFQWTTAGNDRPEEDDWTDFALHESLVFAAWIFGLVLLAATPGYFLGVALSGESVSQTVAQDLERTATAGMAAAAPKSTLWLWMFLNSNSPTFLSASKLVFDFLLMLLSVGIFFPVFYLSSMEAGSYFMLLARGTLRSLAFETLTWIRFYAVVSLLVLSVVGIHFLSMTLMFLGLPERLAYFFFLCLNMSVLTLSMLIYFRLLGRFAWLLETLAQDDDEN